MFIQITFDIETFKKDSKRNKHNYFGRNEGVSYIGYNNDFSELKIFQNYNIQ